MRIKHNPPWLVKISELQKVRKSIIDICRLDFCLAPASLFWSEREMLNQIGTKLHSARLKRFCRLEFTTETYNEGSSRMYIITLGTYPPLL